MDDLPDFGLRSLLHQLGEAEIDFVIVGDTAAIAHGVSLGVYVLDIAYAPDDENLERLRYALVRMGARLRGVADEIPFIPDGQALRQARALRLDTPAGPLNLLAEPEGTPAYRRLRERAVRVDIGGVHVGVASLDDLIAMKKAAGRPKDLVAVEELEAIKRLRRELD